jgi:hypothetical protein
MRRAAGSVVISKVALSGICACLGVMLIVFAGTAPAEWYPAVALFAGLALLVVSHFLTPCIDRIAVWRKRLLK